VLKLFRDGAESAVVQRSDAPSPPAAPTLSASLRGVLLAAIGGLTLAAGALAPAASARPLAGQAGAQARGCSLSLEASAAEVPVGEPVTLSGQLLCAGATSGAAAPIAIYRHQRGAAAAAVASTTTAADGSYQLTVASVDSNSIFIARSDGVHGVHVVVKVQPLVTLAGPSTAQSGARGARRAGTRAGAQNRFSFTGTVAPVAPGSQVALQSDDGTAGAHWRTVGLTRVDDEGHFFFTHTFRTPGQISVRAVTHPHGATSGASTPLSFQVSAENGRSGPARPARPAAGT
jgi:hypothetical protein